MVQSTNEQLKQKAFKIYTILLDHFGLPVWREPLPALDELVSTILSQNTNDRNRDVAFFALKARFPNWVSVMNANLDEILTEIKPAGLANQKGPRIQAVLKQIFDERGELNLDFLKKLDAQQAMDWLTRFKGVGPKTASIVLQFSLGIPAFPVDTHVHRVSGRLGLRPEGMNADNAHPYLAGLFPPETYGPAHLNIIRLGREICNARNPKCEICPLTTLCDYYNHLN